jgi:cold shock CspA family protein
MAKGRFKGWVTGKMFGFIQPDDSSPDVFVLKRDVKDAEQRTPNSIVSFESESTEKGLIGRSLTLVEMAPTNGDVGIEADSPSEGRKRGRVKFFADGKLFGFISRDDDAGDVFVGGSDINSSGVGVLMEGDIVDFEVYRTDKGPAAKDLKIIGYEKTGNEYVDSIQFRTKDWKQQLVKIAADEPWDYANSQSAVKLPILDSYLEHTYLRLAETKGVRVTANEDFLSFNTGLVTDNQEAIYCICELNPDFSGRKWRFAKFVKESDRDFVSKFGANVPPLAEYFEDPSDLLFDRRLQLFINIDHILENIDRFPKHLQGNQFVARQLLTSAQVQTEKRVYRNYKTAIPQFFRDRGKKGVMQLLLPICLEHPSRADLALTVAKNPDGTAYLSSTVLTLDMAYCNARLLARPDTEWLKP